eukprot:jgi/Chlat1/5614/Chrsp369S09001
MDRSVPVEMERDPAQAEAQASPALPLGALWRLTTSSIRDRDPAGSTAFPSTHANIMQAVETALGEHSDIIRSVKRQFSTTRGNNDEQGASSATGAELSQQATVPEEHCVMYVPKKPNTQSQQLGSFLSEVALPIRQGELSTEMFDLEDDWRKKQNEFLLSKGLPLLCSQGRSVRNNLESSQSLTQQLELQVTSLQPQSQSPLLSQSQLNPSQLNLSQPSSQRVKRRKRVHQSTPATQEGF